MADAITTGVAGKGLRDGRLRVADALQVKLLVAAESLFLKEGAVR